MKRFYRIILFVCITGLIVVLSLSCDGEINDNSIKDPKETQKNNPEFDYYNILTGVSLNEFQNSEVTKSVEQYTGCKVTYGQLETDSTAEATSKILDLIQIDQNYEVFKVNKTIFYTLLTKNLVKDLTKYIEKSKNLKNQISTQGYNTASKDGRIYAIPLKNAVYSNNCALAFRKDWLLEYNERNPEKKILVPDVTNGFSMTLSEFEQMLLYFKTKLPEGNDPFAIDNGRVFQENILPAFHINQIWSEVDGKLEYCINQSGFQNYMDYMENLYNEGLINYQQNLQDENCITKMKEGKAAVGGVPHWSAADLEESQNNATDDRIGYIAALIPDENRGNPDAVKTYATGAYSYYTVIPNYVSDEEAARIVEWMDKKLDKDFFIKMVLGTENETYTVKNGEYFPILPVFVEEQGIADKLLDGTREEDYAKYWLCRTRKTKAQDKLFRIANYNIDQTGIIDPIAFMPPNEVYDTYFPKAEETVINCLVMAMFNGKQDIKAGNIINAFNENFGSDITTAVNGWYLSWGDKNTHK